MPTPTGAFHRDLFVTHSAIGKFEHGDDTGTALFTLPKGAFPLRATARVVTAFDGTSATLDVGIAGDTDGLIATATLAPGTAGQKSGTVAVFGPLAADTPVIVTYDDGTGPTEGEVYVIVEYGIQMGLGVSNFDSVGS